MKKDSKRKSFIFYASWKEALMEFPAEVRLEVYDAIIEYAISGTLSELKPLAKMAFAFIKNDIDTYNEKYAEVVNKRSEAGKKGMKSRWEKQKDDNNCYSVITNVTINDNDNKNENKDENIDTTSHKETDRSTLKVDYESIVDKFNEILSPPLPKVVAISEARKKAMKARVAEHGIETLFKVFNIVKESKFLRGESDNGWKCCFDWVLNSTNFIKILEGNYANTRSNNSEKQRANEYALQQFVNGRSGTREKLVSEVDNPF